MAALADRQFCLPAELRTVQRRIAYDPTCAGFLSQERHQPLRAHESWPSLPQWRAVDAMHNMLLVGGQREYQHGVQTR